jgi:hypothetical protein
MTTLALLVGTNPLPTYVVLKYLLEKYINADQQPPRIVLVGTEGVNRVMERLQERINTNFKDYFVKYGYDNSKIKNPEDFKKLNLDQKLDYLSSDINRELGRLPALTHLDFTPGRKTMSAYAVHKALGITDVGVSLSYLDAGKNILRFHNSKENDEENLPSKVSITLEDLFLLHGYRLEKSLPENDTPPEEIIDLSAEIYNIAAPAGENNEFKKYQDWLLFEGLLRGPLNRIAKRATLWPDGDAFKEMGRFIQQYFIQPAKREAEKPTWSDLIEEEKVNFLGILRKDWLTWVVYRELLALKQITGEITSLQVKTLARRVDINDPYRDRTEPFDIAVLQGYRLTLIHCLPRGFGFDSGEPDLIGDLAELKAAAFENLHRSRQWGGDEARFILVTLLPYRETQKLTEDLQYIVSGDVETKANFCILGLGDLQTTQKLQTSLRKFLLGS